MALHRGELAVHSDGEGSGSTFSLVIPLLSAARIEGRDAENNFESRAERQEEKSVVRLQRDEVRSFRSVDGRSPRSNRSVTSSSIMLPAYRIAPLGGLSPVARTDDWRARRAVIPMSATAGQRVDLRVLLVDDDWR